MSRKGQTLPTTSTITAEQPEPTLRDVLAAVNGLGGRIDGLDSRMDRVETRMGSFETEMTALVEYSQQQFVHLTTEIAGVKDTVTRLDNKVTVIDGQLTEVRHDLRMIIPQVEEAVRLGRNNRDMLNTIKADIAHLDAKIDHHRHDDQIHVPRPRNSDAPEIPAAA